MASLKEMVSENRKANFIYYRDGNLWYKTEVGDFEFPVPTEDIGNATFPAQEKALLLMRYIRKHLQLIGKL